jgi:hypothetical protein
MELVTKLNLGLHNEKAHFFAIQPFNLMGTNVVVIGFIMLFTPNVSQKSTSTIYFFIPLSKWEKINYI